MIYILVYWDMGDMKIGGCYSNFPLANDYGKMLLCDHYEIREYEVDSILLE